MSAQRPANNLDALRLIFALMVIVSHAYALQQPSLPDPLAPLGVESIDLGSIAVYGFFVISGYLIAGSFVKSQTLGEYAAKRVLRIYPGFLVAFAASVFVLPWMVDGIADSGVAWHSLLRRAVTLDTPGVAPRLGGTPLNGSMWTILPEFACYVALAVFGVLGGFKHRWPVIAAVLLAYVGHVTLDLRPALAAKLPVRVAAAPPLSMYFLFGMCMYVWRDRIRYSTAALVGTAIVLLASALHPTVLLFVFPPALGYLVLAMGLRSTPYVRRASRFGDFSYGLYLYAFPVQMWLYLRNDDRPPLVDSVQVMFITLPLAVVSWYLVERPAMRWKARHLRSSSAHAAEVTHA